MSAKSIERPMLTAEVEAESDFELAEFPNGLESFEEVVVERAASLLVVEVLLTVVDGTNVVFDDLDDEDAEVDVGFVVETLEELETAALAVIVPRPVEMISQSLQ